MFRVVFTLFRFVLKFQSSNTAPFPFLSLSVLETLVKIYLPFSFCVFGLGAIGQVQRIIFHPSFIRMNVSLPCLASKDA